MVVVLATLDNHCNKLQANASYCILTEDVSSVFKENFSHEQEIAFSFIF
jgi:hypothetical protein